MGCGGPRKRLQKFRGNARQQPMWLSAFLLTMLFRPDLTSSAVLLCSPFLIVIHVSKYRHPPKSTGSITRSMTQGTDIAPDMRSGASALPHSPSIPGDQPRVTLGFEEVGVRSIREGKCLVSAVIMSFSSSDLSLWHPDHTTDDGPLRKRLCVQRARSREQCTPTPTGLMEDSKSHIVDGDALLKDKEYYREDGDCVIQVENTLFKVSVRYISAIALQREKS